MRTQNGSRDLHFDESVTNPLISEIEKRQLYDVSGAVRVWILVFFVLETQIRALRDTLMESVRDVSISLTPHGTQILRPHTHTGTNSALRELILEHVNSGTRKIGNETKTSTPMNLRSESPRKKLMDMKKKKVKKLRHRESSTIRFDDYYRTIGKPCLSERTPRNWHVMSVDGNKASTIVIYLSCSKTTSTYSREFHHIRSILRRFQKFQARFRCDKTCN